MTTKELAHAAQQVLRARAGCDVRRSHVYELLAAAFGFSSWAAFSVEAVLADGAFGHGPTGGMALVAGRAAQLKYPPDAANVMADALLNLAAERQLTSVRWSELHAACIPAARAAGADPLDDEDEWATDEEVSPQAPSGLIKERLVQSRMLVGSLEQAAHWGDPRSHHVLASLYRCERPNPYLYEESLRGRALTAVEQGWVQEYLRDEPRYRVYEAHLKAAALGGVRAAALEYASAFDSREFFELADRLPGNVDAEGMASAAPTPEIRAKWLRQAAEQGSAEALEELAFLGDRWAEERLASAGELQYLRAAAERAVAEEDRVQAWVWQYLARAHGEDLTRSTMRAYHDGGVNHGEFYDSDFGGALFVDGQEGLELPEISLEEHRTAKARARGLFRGSA